MGLAMLVAAAGAAQPGTPEDVASDVPSLSACGLLPLEIACAVLGLGLLAVALWWLPRRPVGRWTTAIDLAILMLVAAVLRFGWLQLHPESIGQGWLDSAGYLDNARLLSSGQAPFWDSTDWHAWSSWIRAPGYYAFLAALDCLAPRDLLFVGRAQALVTTATVGVAYLMARPLFGRCAAWIAGGLLAVFPEAIVSAAWIVREPLYLFFLLAGLAALAWATDRTSWRLAAAAGALLGLACLVRSDPLYFVPLAAVGLILARGRRGWVPALALVGGLALLVIPWMVRNSIIYEAPMPIEDVSVFNFLLFHPDPKYVRIDGIDFDKPGWNRILRQRLKRVNRDSSLSRRSSEIVLRGLGRLLREPGATLHRFGKNLRFYFSPFDEDYLTDHGAPLSPCGERFATDWLNGVFLLALALGALGIVLSLPDRRTWPLALWVVYLTLVLNLLYNPQERYRIASTPVLMAFAGAVLVRFVGRNQDSGARRSGGGESPPPGPAAAPAGVEMQAGSAPTPAPRTAAP
ncbi:MAG: glycosyltransferase family 39 protein [Thermoanaerobaculia bacterium]